MVGQSGAAADAAKSRIPNLKITDAQPVPKHATNVLSGTVLTAQELGELRRRLERVPSSEWPEMPATGQTGRVLGSHRKVDNSTGNTDTMCPKLRSRFSRFH